MRVLITSYYNIIRKFFQDAIPKARVLNIRQAVTEYTAGSH